MEIIIAFNKLHASDTLMAGGKGASLGEMINAGIPVPDGYVITSFGFDKFLKETNLKIKIDNILKTVKIKKIHTIENVSKKIQALILSEEIPKDIKNEILKFFKTLDSKFVAVRSSATSEDSASSAWAGQLDSFLNTTKITLLENIKKCWASLFTHRAILYRFSNKLDKDCISVAVVIQKMIQAEKSGIAFTTHPVTKNKNQIVIEAGLGLGEAIVSGQIIPDCYIVDKFKNKIIDIVVGKQTKALYKNSKNINTWKKLGTIGEKHVLLKSEIIKLSKLVTKIEKHYNFPCDIEWAIEKDKILILQSRPITTLNK